MIPILVTLLLNVMLHGDEMHRLQQPLPLVLQVTFWDTASLTMLTNITDNNNNNIIFIIINNKLYNYTIQLLNITWI